MRTSLAFGTFFLVICSSALAQTGGEPSGDCTLKVTSVKAADTSTESGTRESSSNLHMVGDSASVHFYATSEGQTPTPDDEPAWTGFENSEDAKGKFDYVGTVSETGDVFADACKGGSSVTVTLHDKDLTSYTVDATADIAQFRVLDSICHSWGVTTTIGVEGTVTGQNWVSPWYNQPEVKDSWSLDGHEDFKYQIMGDSTWTMPLYFFTLQFSIQFGGGITFNVDAQNFKMDYSKASPMSGTIAGSTVMNLTGISSVTQDVHEGGIDHVTAALTLGFNLSTQGAKWNADAKQVTWTLFKIEAIGSALLTEYWEDGSPPSVFGVSIPIDKYGIDWSPTIHLGGS
jgi:hypothetical protein